jgi:hypothetical protein
MDYRKRSLDDNSKDESIQEFTKYVREITGARDTIFRNTRCWTHKEKNMLL